MTDPAIIEAAARALHQDDWGVDKPWESSGAEDMDNYRNIARVLIPAVTPRIEAAALEKAAKVTEEMLIAARDWSYAKYGKPIGNDAAQGCYNAMFTAAIRALKQASE